MKKLIGLLLIAALTVLLLPALPVAAEGVSLPWTAYQTCVPVFTGGVYRFSTDKTKAWLFPRVSLRSTVEQVKGSRDSVTLMITATLTAEATGKATPILRADASSKAPSGTQAFNDYLEEKMPGTFLHMDNNGNIYGPVGEAVTFYAEVPTTFSCTVTFTDGMLEALSQIYFIMDGVTVTGSWTAQAVTVTETTVVPEVEVDHGVRVTMTREAALSYSTYGPTSGGLWSEKDLVNGYLPVRFCLYNETAHGLTFAAAVQATVPAEGGGQKWDGEQLGSFSVAPGGKVLIDEMVALPHGKLTVSGVECEPSKLFLRLNFSGTFAFGETFVLACESEKAEILAITQFSGGAATAAVTTEEKYVVPHATDVPLPEGGDETSHFYFEAAKKTPVLGEEFTVTLYSTSMNVASIGGGLFYDKERLELVGLSAPTFTTRAGETVSVPVVSSVREAERYGNIGFALPAGEAAAYAPGAVLTARFRAKATGEAFLYVFEDSDGPDGLMNRCDKPSSVKIGDALLGDLNCDGTVDASDLTLLARHCARIEELTGGALAAADVNRDGAVDASDLTTHARYCARIITEF